MGKTILGVDIGYDSMKLALVKDGKVKKAVTVAMPKNLLREGRVVSPESMGELIRKAMKHSGIRCSGSRWTIAQLLNLHENRLAVLERGGFHHGADRFCNPALLADNLAHIIFSHMELQNDSFRSFGLGNADLIGMLHQRLCHKG